jgi:hypothetical protein
VRRRLALLFIATVTPVAAQAAAAVPAFVPKTFVGRVDNPWFPLTPGTVLVYRGTEGGRPAREVVTVTKRTKTIEGVRATAVDDRLYADGHLAEQTTDWYAQDRAGNVWYLGEATAELGRDGRVTSREGSWLAGRDGARPGIYMPAEPRADRSGMQEGYPGHAEDRYSIVTVHAIAATPFVHSNSALLTREWSRLEPGVLDHKLYVRGVGIVQDETVKGGSDRMALVSVTHRARKGPS